MTHATCRQWLLADRPTGRPLKDSDFKLVEVPLGEPGDGELLVRTLWLGFDPAQKGWMENIGGYVAPMQIDDVIRGSGVGQVVASNAAGFAPGDLVTGLLGWREYLVTDGAGLMTLSDGGSPTAYLGVLGTTGLTAYFGLNKIGRPAAGETVVVSGAAGATGSVAGQIAKLTGCRVVGIAGGADKCAWLTGELGFDAAVDYKAGDVRRQLDDLCPDGIDVFWDNVGGSVLNDGLALLAMHARVVICGGISRYQVGRMPAGPENYFNVVFKRARIEGFIVLDYRDEYPLGRKRLARWIDDGRIKYREDVQKGFENAPRTLMRLFEGANVGKQLLKVTESD